MTIKKANIIGITVGIIIGILTFIPLVYKRIQNLGGIYFESSDVWLSIAWIGIIGFIVYAFIYLFWIQNLIDKENDKVFNKEVNNFITKLKDSSNGEKEVLYKYIYNNNESEILKSVVDAYNPIFIAKIKEDDTVDLIVKDRKTNEIICPPINVKNIEYIVSHFEI